jgi:hypothetical protein
VGALDEQMDRIFAARDRENMQPTIDACEELLGEHPDNARLVYEVGGAYDTAGQEQTAARYYTSSFGILGAWARGRDGRRGGDGRRGLRR